MIETATAETFNKDAILNFSPKQLAEYITQIDEDGELAEFLDTALEDPELVAFLSYWEKWLEKDRQRLVDDIIKEKKEAYPENSESLPLELEKRFSPRELQLIFSNVGAIQLTFGCSKGCPFCGLDAIKDAREHIPYSQLANLFTQYGKQIGLTKPFLYWASEPFDYESWDNSQKRTYQDIHELATEFASYDPGVTTRETKEPDWMQFLDNSKKGGERRISTYGLNPKTVEKIKDNTAQNVIITVGDGEKHQKGIGISFDESNTELTKGTGCIDGILITPRGLYNVAQTDLSSKNPQGQIIIPLENISDKKPKIGENIENVLKNYVIRQQRNVSNIPSRKLTICGQSELWEIEFNSENKITAVEDPSKKILQSIKIENILLQRKNPKLEDFEQLFPPETEVTVYGEDMHGCLAVGEPTELTIDPTEDTTKCDHWKEWEKITWEEVIHKIGKLKTKAIRNFGETRLAYE